MDPESEGVHEEMVRVWKGVMAMRKEWKNSWEGARG